MDISGIIDHSLVFKLSQVRNAANCHRIGNCMQMYYDAAEGLARALSKDKADIGEKKKNMFEERENELRRLYIQCLLAQEPKTSDH